MSLWVGPCDRFAGFAKFGVGSGAWQAGGVCLFLGSGDFGVLMFVRYLPTLEYFGLDVVLAHVEHGELRRLEYFGKLVYVLDTYFLGVALSGQALLELLCGFSGREIGMLV